MQENCEKTVKNAASRSRLTARPLVAHCVPTSFGSYDYITAANSAILPAPRSDKARVLIQGRYQAHDSLQLLEPRAVIDQLLDTVFAVQRYVLVAMGLVAVATSAVVLLVFLLSWRARRPEQETLHRLGGSRGAILSLMLAEVVMVMLAASALAAVLVVLTNWFGGPLLKAVVM